MSYKFETVIVKSTIVKGLFIIIHNIGPTFVKTTIVRWLTMLTLQF